MRHQERLQVTRKWDAPVTQAEGSTSRVMRFRDQVRWPVTLPVAAFRFRIHDMLPTTHRPTPPVDRLPGDSCQRRL